MEVVPLIKVHSSPEVSEALRLWDSEFGLLSETAFYVAPDISLEGHFTVRLPLWLS